ncbi:HWE histidine kinase domain-containing protein [uncultured Roseobacter sp.]|uniref:HWE histidine kinase domain-containing protein n=1 Tax=uncultured Roseobacter sp. TaxID=114847 RepID=UPI00260ED3A3|nr:HWE histidine kinase domain-containing protein [uncultured Roseobacter sp.]
MDKMPDTEEIARAVERCSEEPIRIPGVIQGFGCLIAADATTGAVRYASENAAGVFRRPLEDVLTASLCTLFDEEILHGIRNALARGGAENNAVFAGCFLIGEQYWDLSICESTGCTVVSMEPAGTGQSDQGCMLQSMSFMIGKILNCHSHPDLFALTVQLVRHLTGFDRVLVYRFDQAFNGEVLAETCRPGMQSFAGLWFPRYDIPDQAREMMKRIPLRICGDTSADQIPVVPARQNLPPLDLTHSVCRGMSGVHLQYLRNMGSAATLTLHIVVEDELWGVISCHHETPRRCDRSLQEILENIIPVFSAKLLSIRRQDTLDRIRQLDSYVIGQASGSVQLDSLLTEVAPGVLDVIGADGIATLNPGRTTRFGLVPEQSLLDQLQICAEAQEGDVLAIDNLADRFPAFAEAAGDCAGALVTALSPDSLICVFRKEMVREVSWAGNPDKTVELQEGVMRLTPRASFSAFLEVVEGSSRAWSEDDLYFIQHVRTLLHASERQSLMNRMNRQQSLMIDELNHRVRNILALVRSVSHQARRRHSSVESYAAAMEGRIQALAASHDLIAGSLPHPVSLLNLIRKELEPYSSISDRRVGITGDDRSVLAEIAPFFSLIMHEMITNAVKYGALSVEGGSVRIAMTRAGDGAQITWAEEGGPPVETSPEAGFGTAMITRSVPFELGGKSELFFRPDGVSAHFFFPGTCFDDTFGPAQLTDDTPQAPKEAAGIPAEALKGTVLLLEDNFIIGAEMCDQLRDFGFAHVALFSNAQQAMAFLDAQTPVLAVLDFNLGKAQTSEAVAIRLRAAGVPVVFVTGYGDKAASAPELRDVPRMTKPVSVDSLRDELSGLLQ